MYTGYLEVTEHRRGSLICIPRLNFTKGDSAAFLHLSFTFPASLANARMKLFFLLISISVTFLGCISPYFKSAALSSSIFSCSNVSQKSPFLLQILLHLLFFFFLFGKA